MCGIAGWIESKTANPELLEKMADTLAHRGPDGKGTFFTKTRHNKYNVALAHRRLAIIDLVTGNQPMHSQDGKITVILNGEIYNFKELREQLKVLGYVFSTTSDTEVLLAAYQIWGDKCVHKLEGMFAFALWDSTNEQLMLARDRFGEKPLYLTQQKDSLLFASEIKALLAHPGVKRELDLASVLDYLQYRYVPGPYTLFMDIIKLNPGSYSIWKNGTLTSHVYYTPPDGNTQPSTNPKADFLATLDDSVRTRMISDVPFGAFLSGGIDSSAVVALMSRHSTHPINTFSIGFEEKPYSELHFAQMVAERFKTNHHEFMAKPADIMTHLPAMIAMRDAPVAEPSDIPLYMLSVEAAKSVKMVLTGEGADEILAGYPKHLVEPYIGLYQNIIPDWAHEMLVQPMAGRLPHRIQTMLACLGLRVSQERFPRWFGALSIRERAQLVKINAEARTRDIPAFSADPMQSRLRKILYFDQTSWLPDNLLERSDRMTMAASLEARMPFMDHTLAEMVSRCPDTKRIHWGKQKILLRNTMKPILPREILTRKKMGFRVPIKEWLRTTLKDFAYDHLLGTASQTHNFYDSAKLEALLNEHTNKQKNHEKLIWTLLSLELFVKQYSLI